MASSSSSDSLRSDIEETSRLRPGSGRDKNVTRSVSLDAPSIPHGVSLRRGGFLFGRVRFQLTDCLLAAPVFCAPLLDERARDVSPRVVRALGGSAGVRARIPCDLTSSSA